MPRTHGIPQGSADPCVFTRQRKIAISSRRLDTALLCAAKKRGVEKNQLAGLCQNLPWTTGPVKKPLAAAGSKKKAPTFVDAFSFWSEKIISSRTAARGELPSSRTSEILA